jgi:hypothetical protein
MQDARPLNEKPLTSLRTMAKELGLLTTGKKAEVITRIETELAKMQRDKAKDIVDDMEEEEESDSERQPVVVNDDRRNWYQGSSSTQKINSTGSMGTNSNNDANSALAEIRDMFRVLTETTLNRQEQTDHRTFEGMQVIIRKNEANEKWPERLLNR